MGRRRDGRTTADAASILDGIRVSRFGPADAAASVARHEVRMWVGLRRPVRGAFPLVSVLGGAVTFTDEYLRRRYAPTPGEYWRSRCAVECFDRVFLACWLEYHDA